MVTDLVEPSAIQRNEFWCLHDLWTDPAMRSDHAHWPLKQYRNPATQTIPPKPSLYWHPKVASCFNFHVLERTGCLALILCFQRMRLSSSSKSGYVVLGTPTAIVWSSKLRESARGMFQVLSEIPCVLE